MEKRSTLIILRKNTHDGSGGNVLLDVFQNRQPHYDASARVLSMVCEGRLKGIYPHMV